MRDLLQSLIGIIFRFREKKIALTADVEAMFLQVKIPPADFKVLRFLWREDSTDPISEYEYGRHIFGAKSSPTCVNNALLQVGRNSRDDKEMVAKLINRNFCEVSSFRGRSRGSVQMLAKVLSRWGISTDEMDLQLRESNGKNIS